MNIKEALATTTTARRATVNIDPLGEVLFIEPTIAALNAEQKRYMRYGMRTGKKGEPEVELDTEKSDMAAYNRALVALTARDIGTGGCIFKDHEEVLEAFSAEDEEGHPRHGSGLFNAFVSAANEVCGAVDTESIEKD